MMTMAESLSSNTSAMPIRTKAQNKLTSLENLKFDFPPNQSIIVEDARELIDELSVDIAAERIPASNNPLKPTGRYWTINVENSLSFSSSTPPRKRWISEPANKKDKRNNLILNFARAVKEIRPKFFVMENVRGINNKKYQPLIAEFLKILNNSGYKNIISSVLCAADYGIPQLRYRTFFFGSLCGSELQFPKIKIKDKLKYKTLKDCIFDLEGKESSISNHIPMKHNKIVKERIS